MSGGLVTAAYIVAAILFIFSLAGLSKHETSRQGNNFGIAGMAIALIATIFGPDTGNVGWILLAMVIGGAIGIRLAKKVEMTEMPELVAILHSFVGLAAVLVGFNSYLHHDAGMAPILVNIHLTEVFLGIFIGAVTFTGSVVAFGKLCGKISSKPLMLPNRHKMNLAALVVSFLLLIVFVRTDSVGLQVLALLIMTAIALVFGWHLVASIGGADMPVVVSMLNSYSGWAAAAAGFMLSNDLLIVTGALVGSSGAILSYIMCKAMNRSFISVIAGGFGTDGSSKPLMLPNRHKMNLAALVVSFLLLIVFVRTDSVGLQVLALLIMTAIALVFGWHLVASIGGADMPVVVSMLNSYSGWAAAAAGFMLSNDLLIVTGALVGSSGAILSYIMCKAMNRSFISVIAGGFGTDGSSTGDDQEVGEHREITAEETAELLKNSHSVIITPGYGMAVAQAQYPVAEITEKLRARGINVRFGIHPVAGRLP